jgi:RimJ/RimL family protein N-acetyltransferase
VFAHNHRARALYAAAGFIEVGTTRDRFRVDGVAIDDVAMTLAL